MKRDEDMLEAIGKIRRYMDGIAYDGGSLVRARAGAWIETLVA